MEFERRAFDEVFEQKLNHIIEKVNDIHEVIHGNGDPEKGVVVKLTRVSEKIKFNSAMIKLFGSLIIIIIGTIVKLAFF